MYNFKNVAGGDTQNPLQGQGKGTEGKVEGREGIDERERKGKENGIAHPLVSA